MRVLAMVLALGLAGTPAWAEVKVAVRGDRMDIVATRANVADILDKVAKQTGMRVIYDGPRPKKMLTKSVNNRTPADAVLGILEGEGLNYAVILNSSGTHIETLLVTGPSTAKVSRPGAPPPQPDWVVDAEIPPPPPPPAPDQEGGELPAAPPDATPAATAPPITLATPRPPPTSPFTPQGAGPVLLPIPGSTPTPYNR